MATNGDAGDGVTGIEANGALGGSATITVIGRSLRELHEERRLRLEAERRAALAAEWRDHYEARWRGAERRVARAMRANRALWERLRLWQSWARSGWGAALVLALVTLLTTLALYRALGG